MKKGQSLNRKFNRGNLVSIWNETLKRPDVFRRTKKGKFVLTSPFNHNSTLGKSLSKEEFNFMKKKAVA